MQEGWSELVGGCDAVGLGAGGACDVRTVLCWSGGGRGYGARGKEVFVTERLLRRVD